MTFPNFHLMMTFPAIRLPVIRFQHHRVYESQLVAGQESEYETIGKDTGRRGSFASKRPCLSFSPPAIVSAWLTFLYSDITTERNDGDDEPKLVNFDDHAFKVTGRTSAESCPNFTARLAS
jgi:hypothetical protein